jgi:hypothetical protein
MHAKRARSAAEECAYVSTDEAVRAVGILHEVLGVPARIPTPVLREEHAVRVISPARTRAPHILGSETLRKVTSCHGTADVFDKPAHELKCGTGDTDRRGLAGRWPFAA